MQVLPAISFHCVKRIIRCPQTVFLLFCILLHGIIADLHAQEYRQAFLDSLKEQINTLPDDTNKVQLLYVLSFRYHIIDPDSGMKYGQIGVDLAEQLGWEKGKAKCYNALGSVCRIRSDYSEALDYFFKALAINEHIGEKLGKAYNYGNIGIVYKTQKDYEHALEYYSKALEVYKELDNKNGVAVNLGNIGILYEALGRYEDALDYQQQALKINTEGADESGIAYNLGNIALLYNAMGKYPEALDNIFKALAINERLGTQKLLTNNYRGIGSIYCNIAKDSSLGRTKRVEAAIKAIRYLDKGIDIAQDICDKKNLMEMHDLLAEAYLQLGNYRQAFEKYKTFIRYRDSIFSAETAEKITTLITKRELDIRDREIQLRNKQIELDKLAVAKKNNERGFFIAGLILLSITTVVIFRNYKIQKRSNELLDKEKQKSDDLLLNILPEEVTEELKERGATTAHHFDHVTVIFTDFVAFTKAGERMGSQALVEELHSCFKVFDEIMEQHGIEKIKTIGDAYLAVCGLPSADENHAEKVVKAAQDIIVFMQQRREQLGDKTFEIRIGIHSGEVVAGIVGVKKFAYDIWGDTVNTAARMEQNSEPGKINISQTTYELVKDNFKCTYRGELEAKNKGRLKMYFVS